VHEPVLLFAYRFGHSIPWSDVPYCWHLQPRHARIVPPAEAGGEERALLWITLVGADDGIIHAQRGMTLAPEFTQAIHSAIRHQAHGGFHPDDCISALRDLYLSHPLPEQRLALARSRTIGNR
jgi:hypothetical protein